MKDTAIAGQNQLANVGWLRKLSAIEVDRKKQLDSVDQAFCDEQDRLYSEAVALLSETKAKMEALYAQDESENDWEKKGYIDRYKDISHVDKRLAEIRKEHVSKIAGHFAKRYKVTIETGEILRELEGKEVTAAAIVDQIYRQLGGATFQEKAVLEIKTDLASLIRWEPEIKGNRIVIRGVIYSEKRYDGSPRISYHSQEGLRALLRALQHFDTGQLELAGPYASILSLCSPWLGRENPFRRYEVGSGKVEAVRFFQNGKVEIAFRDYALAAEFVAGYTRRAG